MNREAVRLVAIAIPVLLIVAIATWLAGQGAFGAGADAPSPDPSIAMPGSPPGSPAASAPPELVAADSPVIGSAEAPVTVVEFLDFECEACGAAFPIVKQMLSEYEGRVRYVVRDFPGHNNSVLAASAAYAAGEQGKYWEMYDLLFERQTEWGERQESQLPLFVEFAEELGLDAATFRSDLESEQYVDRIRRDFEEGRALGVDATPTFFINGDKFVGVPSYEDLTRLIDEAIAAGA
jgi:protein-disulfide isomerase